MWWDVGWGYGPLPMPEQVTESDAQVQWWMKKIEEHDTCQSSYRLRSVGSMYPSNLHPTQPKGCRNKRGDQRKKFQDNQRFPEVGKQLRHPPDMELAFRLLDLETSMDGHGPSFSEVRGLLRVSFQRAFDSVSTAAQAYEDLSKKTQKLLKNNPDAAEQVKKAKMRTRDAVLWRWFGLTGWIYNQAESEFFHLHGKELESQLMNGVARIRQFLMQKLMRRPCWQKLERILIQCAAEDSWTPELQGLMDRFHYTLEHLGGNAVVQEFQMSEDEEKELLKTEEAMERAADEAFADEVWANACQVTESMIVHLGLDDF